jgi:hypothetical protein
MNFEKNWTITITMNYFCHAIIIISLFFIFFFIIILINSISSFLLIQFIFLPCILNSLLSTLIPITSYLITISSHPLSFQILWIPT